MKRRRALVASSLLAAGLLFWVPAVPEALLHPRNLVSQRLYDRHGKWLRDVMSRPDGVSTWLPLDQISPDLVAATVASEDHRFWSHWGFDVAALLRAARVDLAAGGIREGGSTITQQLVRDLSGAEGGRWRAKLAELYWAVRLERRMSKREILEAYLNRIPYGSQCYGCEAASQFYFARPASALSLAQAAFLAVLPRAPEAFAPYQSIEEVLPWQRQLLQRMHALGLIDEERLRLALDERIVLDASQQSREAGHFCDQVARLHPTEAAVTTTLDLTLQHEVERILAAQIHRLSHSGVGNGAVVVLDVDRGDILAMAGSADYAGGQFNAALARRQPGSTLKPFTYSLGLERNLTAASILPDLDLYPHQTDRGFIPRNYDDRFHGPVRLREALACSYNVPVVRVLESVSTDSLLRRLRLLGFAGLTQTPEHYGLGLTLGDGEVSLLELCQAYRALARGGRVGPARYLANEKVVSPGPPVIDPRVCAVLTDILKDPDARAPAFGIDSVLRMPFECAVKTGTSKDFRDNWTVGFTSRFVVGVWVGNFDALPMHGVSGVTGAGPVFREAMEAVRSVLGPSERFALPSGMKRMEVCAASGELPGPDCPSKISELFLADKVPARVCDVHRRVEFDTRSGRPASSDCPSAYRRSRVIAVFPPIYRDWMIRQGMTVLPTAAAHPDPVAVAFPDSGSIFRIDPVLRREMQSVHLRAVVPSNTARVSWSVDGRSLPVGQRFDAWWPLERGDHHAVVQAFDREGRALGASRPLGFKVL